MYKRVIDGYGIRSFAFLKPQLGIMIPAETLRRFWTMVAHDHAQTWNAAEFARSLGGSEATALQSHPKLGASWEGFAIEQTIGLPGTRDAYFWATQGGAELDLLVHIADKRYGFEFRFADAPDASRSMPVALQDLALEHLWIIDGSISRLGQETSPARCSR